MASVVLFGRGFDTEDGAPAGYGDQLQLAVPAS